MESLTQTQNSEEKETLQQGLHEADTFIAEASVEVEQLMEIAPKEVIPPDTEVAEVSSQSEEPMQKPSEERITLQPSPDIEMLEASSSADQSEENLPKEVASDQNHDEEMLKASSSADQSDQNADSRPVSTADTESSSVSECPPNPSQPSVSDTKSLTKVVCRLELSEDGEKSQLISKSDSKTTTSDTSRVKVRSFIVELGVPSATTATSPAVANTSTLTNSEQAGGTSNTKPAATNSVQSKTGVTSDPIKVSTKSSSQSTGLTNQLKYSALSSPQSQETKTSTQATPGETQQSGPKVPRVYVRSGSFQEKRIMRRRLLQKMKEENPGKKLPRILHCTVANCESTSLEYPDLPFFKIPRQEPRFSLWIEGIGRLDFKKKKQLGQKIFGRVCGLHFHANDYASTGRRLKLGAIPTEEVSFATARGSNPNTFHVSDYWYDKNISEGQVRDLIKEPPADSDSHIHPRINSELQDEHVRSDTDQVMLSCMVNVSSADVSWFHNGKLIEPCCHLFIRYFMAPSLDRTYAQLFIARPCAVDAGIYMCRVRNRTGQAFSACYLSIVGLDSEKIHPPPNAKCQKCIHPQEPAAKKARLTGETVTKDVWLGKDSSKLRPHQEVDNRGPKRPRFLKALSNYVAATYGRSLALRCTVDTLNATTKWYWNGSRIKPCKHYEILHSKKETSKDAVLIIHPIMEKEDGLYTCVAIDGNTIISTSSFVTLQGHQITDHTDRKNCRKCVWVRESTASLNRYQLQHEEGRMRQRRQKPELRQLRDGEPRLRLSQTGAFVPAENSIHNADARSPSPPLPTVDDNVPPMFVKKLGDKQVHSNDSALLICVVNVESARHEWYFDGRKIVSCPDYEISRSVDAKSCDRRVVAMLCINRVIDDDIGVYTCVATNSAGSMSTSCYINVLGLNQADKPALKCAKCKRENYGLKEESEEPEAESPEADQEKDTEVKESEQNESVVVTATGTQRPASPVLFELHEQGKEVVQTCVEQAQPTEKDRKKEDQNSGTLVVCEEDQKSVTVVVSEQNECEEDLNKGEKDVCIEEIQLREKDIKKAESRGSPAAKISQSNSEKDTENQDPQLLLVIAELGNEAVTEEIEVSTTKEISQQTDPDQNSESQELEHSKYEEQESAQRDATLESSQETDSGKTLKELDHTEAAEKKDITQELTTSENSKQSNSDKKLESKKLNHSEAEVSRAHGSATSESSLPTDSGKQQDKSVASKITVTQELIGVKDTSENNVKLMCAFDCPSADITWLFMGNRITECHHFSLEEEVNNGEKKVTLTLSVMWMVDMGVYTCLAKNKGMVASTSCNVTIKSMPMTEYMRSCKKCIMRISGRRERESELRKYQYSSTKPRKVIVKLSPATSCIPASSYRIPVSSYRIPVSSYRIPEASQYNHLGKAIVPPSVPSLSDEKSRGLSLDHQYTKQNAFKTLAHTANKYVQTSVKAKRIFERNATLSKRIKTIRTSNGRTVSSQKRKIERLEEKLKEKEQQSMLISVVKKKFRMDRKVQTLKKHDPATALRRVRKRNKELVKNLETVSGKYGACKKEVSRLENKRQLEEQKHIVTVSELEKKILDLEEALRKRRSESSTASDVLARQLQNRREAGAFAGFLQYMAEPSQEFN